MKTTPNILISGSGSVIGLGAAKLISQYRGVGKVVVANTSDYFPAKNYASDYLITPDYYFTKKSTENEFIEFILEYAVNNNIDLIVPCSIFELKAYAKNLDKFKSKGITVFVESEELIDVFYDKYGTSVRLNSIEECSPVSGTLQDSESDFINMRLPCIIKPRYGYGSNGISLIRSKNDFMKWLNEKNTKYSPYIWQEYLEDQQEEYSCSVLYDTNHNPFSICAARRLSVKKVTVDAEYDEKCQSIETLVLNIAKNIKGRYCLNYQFRMKDGKPYIFEINPRFAASEAIRAEFGHDPFYLLMRQFFDVNKSQIIKYGRVIRAYKEEFFPY
ncbi:MAG: hypothetical protein DRQ49_14755 [Gammaproteobacteria bacterium]|nr:MAG: hypothetical protein DRQ49_14755 [Gammaproteobacteria bacterium]